MILVGPAIIVGLPDHDGESTDVPPGVLELLTRTVNWSIEVLVIEDRAWYQVQMARGDYWNALLWANLFLDSSPGADDVRIIRLPDKK